MSISFQSPIKPTVAPPPPFRPKFINATVTDKWSGAVNPLNPFFFATKDTAIETMKRLVDVGALSVFEAPKFDNPAAVYSEQMYVVRFTDGLEINAGQLASYWERNPEDLFPNVALNLARTLVRQAQLERSQRLKEASGASESAPVPAPTPHPPDA